MQYAISTAMRLCGTDFLKEKVIMLAYRCLITLLTAGVLLRTGVTQTTLPPSALPTVPASPGMGNPVGPATVGTLEQALLTTGQTTVAPATARHPTLQDQTEPQ